MATVAFASPCALSSLRSGTAARATACGVRLRALTACIASPPTSGASEALALTAFRDLSTSTSRGRYATEEQRAEAERLIAQLEAVPQAPPLTPERAPLLDGTWQLLFLLSTRSAGLQSSSIQRADATRREVTQAIDVAGGRVVNEARFSWLGLPLAVRINAAFTALDVATVAVAFRHLYFAVAGLTVFWFPVLLFRPSGSLKTTYLSDELRVGRGDKGSIFVLAKQSAQG